PSLVQASHTETHLLLALFVTHTGRLACVGILRCPRLGKIIEPRSHPFPGSRRVRKPSAQDRRLHLLPARVVPRALELLACARTAVHPRQRLCGPEPTSDGH